MRSEDPHLDEALRRVQTDLDASISGERLVIERAEFNGGPGCRVLTGSGESLGFVAGLFPAPAARAEPVERWAAEIAAVISGPVMEYLRAPWPPCPDDSSHELSPGAPAWVDETEPALALWRCRRHPDVRSRIGELRSIIG